jgi:hypothetical protein
MRFPLRTLMIVLALAPLLGCTSFFSDDVDALYYEGFLFYGTSKGDFNACGVYEKGDGLKNIFVSFRGSPRIRLADLTWEDFVKWNELSEKNTGFLFYGNADHGTVTDGSSFNFEKGKLSRAEIHGSSLEYSGSENGPFVEFTAIEGRGPTREQIEAAFGKPMRVGKIGRVHGI